MHRYSFSVHLQVLCLAISFGCTRFYCWQIRFHCHIWKKHLGIKIKIVFCSTAITYEVTKSFEWLQTQFNLLNACNINEELIVEQVGTADSEDEVVTVAVNPFESHFLTILLIM